MKPQLENGYTKIANEIMDALCRTRIKGECRQLFDFIIRKTYGFNKKTDMISTKQIIKGTGLGRSSIYKARRWLRENNYITVSQKVDSLFLSYCIQKDYNKWQVSPKKETVSQLGRRVSPKTVGGVSPNWVNATITKETLTKETIQKKETLKFFESVWSKYPKRIGKKMAEKHFRASVKTQEDFARLNKALANYLSSERVKNGYIQNGATFFNNWEDWVDYKEPETERPQINNNKPPKITRGHQTYKEPEWMK